ncbi:v-type proton atpase subunit h [Anaeramoeba ignava]|uniref:V-type proton atpase subunit h n=1 Tax=Anaeramoeba ignava TaxID=1746090 RepID=A0A9Q0L939_ANAIG|nr:v-type proton atpase subunit h [Anaeramoeba ignava]
MIFLPEIQFKPLSPPKLETKSFTRDILPLFSNNVEHIKKIRSKAVDWDSIKGLLDNYEHVLLFRDIEKKSLDELKIMVQEEGKNLIHGFCIFLTKITSTDILKIFATLFDDLLIEFPSFAEEFNRLEDRQELMDSLIKKILSISMPLSDEPKNYYLLSLYLRITATLLTLLNLLYIDSQGEIQFIYEICLCIWTLSLNQNIVGKLNEVDLAENENFKQKSQKNLVSNSFQTYQSKKKCLINIFADILKTNAKEKDKIVRMILATLVNMSNKSNHNEEMVEAGFLRILNSLYARNWEQQIKENLDSLSTIVQDNLKIFCSWDKYVAEAENEKMEWSPTHKSKLFWEQNIIKFEENDYQLLRVLVHLLKNENPQNVAIACHDIGEFSKYHPRGKQCSTSFKALICVNAKKFFLCGIGSFK